MLGLIVKGFAAVKGIGFADDRSVLDENSFGQPVRNILIWIGIETVEIAADILYGPSGWNCWNSELLTLRIVG